MPSLSSFMKSPPRAERKKASPPPSSPGGHDMFSPGPSSTRKRRPSQDDALPPVDENDDADPLRRDVRVGPGRIGVIFEDVARGVGARVAVVTRESPLQGIVDAGWIITSVNGVDVTGVGAAAAEAVVEKRGDQARRLIFEAPRGVDEVREIALEKAALKDVGASLAPDVKPPTLETVPPGTLLGRVAPGSRIVSVDGVDLTGLDAREARMVFGKLTGTAFALRFVTPSVQPVLLDHVDFFEDKSFDASKNAASAWCEHSGVVLASVETVNRGRQGDRIRLWYNKLDRRNLRPAVALAVEEHSQGIRPSSVAFGGDLPRPPPPTPPRDSPGDSPGRRAVKKVVSIFSSPAKVDEEV
jgi:hypothetical protein